MSEVVERLKIQSFSTIGETRLVMREAAAEIERLKERERNRRWNIQRDGDALLICEGDHHRSQDCEYERYVPERLLSEAWEKAAGIAEMHKDTRFIAPPDDWTANVGKRVAAAIRSSAPGGRGG